MGTSRNGASRSERAAGAWHRADEHSVPKRGRSEVETVARLVAGGERTEVCQRAIQMPDFRHRTLLRRASDVY
jgi:hypothetical protein